MKPIRSSIVCIMSMLIATLFVSCEKEDEFDNLTVQDELQSYFDAFVEEGAKRNITVDFDAFPVTAEITDIEGTTIAGQCYHLEHKPSHIRIDEDIWTRSDTFTRELILFHELGHCYLQRDHLDEAFPNGSCTSMMASGEGSCRLKYNNYTRNYYLDELFSYD